MMNTMNWETNTMGYATVETLLEEVSNHMASSNISRYARPGAQKSGGSTRIVKPSSNSNSPRKSMTLGRRRTVMADGAYRRRPAMIDQTAMVSGEFVSNDGLQIPAQTARPVSWHPESHIPQETYQPPYHVPTSHGNNQFHLFDLPPTPIPYSGYTSPDWTFSPLSGPFNGYEQPSYPHQEFLVSYQANPSYMTNHARNIEQQSRSFSTQVAENVDPTIYSTFDWNNFATCGFENSTAPPTPEYFLPIQHPNSTFPSEDAIPYHPLSDSEEAGEELIGMGLYDIPESAKPFSPDLENYQYLVYQLRSGLRRPEPVGRGLKLEETWNPPASDDGEDEDDSEQDGEGEDEEESSPERIENSNKQLRADFVSTQKNFAGQIYDKSGWL